MYPLFQLHEILKNHGIVVVSYPGFDTESIIDENDFLWVHRVSYNFDTDIIKSSN